MRFSCLAFLPLCGAMVTGVAAPVYGAQDVAVKNTCQKISSENMRGLAPLKVDKVASAQRVALVIGNSVYSNGIPSLKGPANDARAVTDTLSRLGFTIFQSINGDASVIEDCSNQLAESLRNGDIALVYYSGHGIQIDGRDYIVAADAKPDGDVTKGYVLIDGIIGKARDRASSVLVLLDASRDYPFSPEESQGLSGSTGRGIESGLKSAEGDSGGKTPQARGILVAYSTSPNSVASDGSGDLSPFTEAFVKAIAVPGHSIQRALSEVTRDVGEATDWQQTPWTTSSLTDEIKLNGSITLEEAVANSDNAAGEANRLLNTGDVNGAIIAAMKGIPPNLALSERAPFKKAFVALAAATRSSSLRLPILSGDRFAVIVSPDGDRAVTYLHEDDKRPELEIWDTIKATSLGTVTPRKFSFVTPTFSSDGNFLAVDLGAGKVGLINPANGEQTRTLEIPGVGEYESIAHLGFGEASDFIVVGMRASRNVAPITVWNTKTGAIEFNLDASFLNKAFHHTTDWQAISGYGQLDESGTYISFICLNDEYGQASAAVFGIVDLHSKALIAGQSISFQNKIDTWESAFGSAEDKFLFRFSSDDFKIALFDAKTGILIGPPVSGFHASFSPDRALFYVGDVHDFNARVHSTETGEQISNYFSDENGPYVTPGLYNFGGVKIGEFMIRGGSLVNYMDDVFGARWMDDNLLTYAREKLIRNGIEDQVELMEFGQR